MDHLLTYVSHVVIRGIIYRVIFHLPPIVLIVLGLAACYIIVGRGMRKRRTAKK